MGKDQENMKILIENYMSKKVTKYEFFPANPGKKILNDDIRANKNVASVFYRSGDSEIFIANSFQDCYWAKPFCINNAFWPANKSENCVKMKACRDMKKKHTSMTDAFFKP